MLRDLKREPKLGQVWTPNDLASQMSRSLLKHLNKDAKIIDPACGPGTFSKALANNKSQNFSITCFDIDQRFSELTAQINSELRIKSSIKNVDYLLDDSLTSLFDGAILNPPYLRHEELKNKNKYVTFLENKYAVKIDKRSNLFCYFLLKTLNDLKVGGVMCAIVYDAIKETAYGKKTLKLLNKHAELISIEHIKTPFVDVLVDANILIYKKRKDVISESIILDNDENSNLVNLDELLDTKRGTCFIKRDIFLAKKEDPYYYLSSPFFIKQGQLKGYHVLPDKSAYIFNKSHQMPEKFIQWIENRAKINGKEACRLTNNNVNAPILFNYYIRNNPRHLINKDNFNVSDNFYASTPKHNFPVEAAWLLLNSDLFINKILDKGRNQGNGLIKLQLFEYKNVKLPNWNKLKPSEVGFIAKIANKLLNNKEEKEKVVNQANFVIRKYFNEFQS
tara:strand:- start:4436 stop:5782 length:1347 start_codon:yes stop_codon:yes gene_type:complete